MAGWHINRWKQMEPLRTAEQVGVLKDFDFCFGNYFITDLSPIQRGCQITTTEGNGVL